MNSSYRSVSTNTTGIFVADSENATTAGKKFSPGTSVMTGNARFALKRLAVFLMLAFGSSAAHVYALPVGGIVSAGGASISSTVGSTTVTQSSQNVAINWQSFSIGQGEAVRFQQPNSSSVALNRVLGADPSSILGSLTANGKVFLVNPNGILFGNGAQVNVGGLVASTLNIADSDFMAGRYQFSGTSGALVLNQGSINADGGFVALLGANVSNEGVISARLGTVVLAAGNAITLDVAGDGLLNITVSQGAVNALVQNGGLIQADGGQVLLTAMAAGSLLQSAVNNTGVIQAQTIANHNGTIRLLGDMQSGVVNVGGTMDASAPNGGNGGFIETSAAHVSIANDAKITTSAPAGLTGNWLIDPVDFNIQALGGDISGPTLSALLVNNSVTISTVVTGTNTATTFFAAPGQGDINVNDAVGWTAAGGPTTLTLNAARDANLNRAITATTGNLVVCCGRDVNVNATVTTTNGSVLLSAGRNANVNAAVTTTDGNLEICAGHDVILMGPLAAITVTRGSLIPGQSLVGLGVPFGLTLSAGTDGSGPGVVGGTVTFAPATPPIALTNAPATINYNPVSYTTPTNYSGATFFTLVGGAAVVTQHMLVFPGGADKAFDGSTAATFTGLKGAPAGVTLAGAGTANFNTAAVGAGKTVTYTGFTLAGVNAANFAFPITCCAPVVQQTTANITAAPPVIPPVPPGGVILPPGVVLPPGVILSPAVLASLLPIHNSDSLVSPLVPSGLNLTVTDTCIRMPPVELALASPPQIAPVIVPPEAPSPIYRPPPLIRKQDRN